MSKKVLIPTTGNTVSFANEVSLEVVFFVENPGLFRPAEYLENIEANEMMSFGT